ncbi:MAG: DUF3570 domain-containing protein [Betaproteobacteria bacterium]|nr:DUF3570 domain-containing protein [Betaproteobacteria bacterium]
MRAPLGERWAAEVGVTADSVSGASPRYHTAISGASRMSDERRAGDVKVTRFDERSSWSLGAAASDENDFTSRAVSAQASWASDDNNRSWNAGIGYIRDRIGSSNDPALDERRRTLELAGGVTQALSRLDLVQLGLTLVEGRGYYTDPYKSLDARPDARRQAIATVRWNHHFEASEITLRSHYRHYRDSFGVRSHTLQFDPIWQATTRLAITPSLRLYTQTAASFYYDPVYSFLGAPLPPGYVEAPPRYLSADQRLSAFGAVTLGIRLALAARRRLGHRHPLRPLRAARGLASGWSRLAGAGTLLGALSAMGPVAPLLSNPGPGCAQPPTWGFAHNGKTHIYLTGRRSCRRYR